MQYEVKCKVDDFWETFKNFEEDPTAIRRVAEEISTLYIMSIRRLRTETIKHPLSLLYERNPQLHHDNHIFFQFVV